MIATENIRDSRDVEDKWHVWRSDKNNPTGTYKVTETCWQPEERENEEIDAGQQKLENNVNSSEIN